MLNTYFKKGLVMSTFNLMCSLYLSCSLIVDPNNTVLALGFTGDLIITWLWSRSLSMSLMNLGDGTNLLQNCESFWKQNLNCRCILPLRDIKYRYNMSFPRSVMQICRCSTIHKMATETMLWTPCKTANKSKYSVERQTHLVRTVYPVNVL